jgi:hypothetical protein
MAYYGMAVLSMTCHLITILMATLVRHLLFFHYAFKYFCVRQANVYGPGLALRGPSGSMKTAVDGMKIEQAWIIKFFGVGVFFFHVAAIMFAWIAFESELVIILITVVLSVFVVLFCTSSSRIYDKFKIPDEKLVTGGYGVEEKLYGQDAQDRISLVRRTRQAYEKG